MQSRMVREGSVGLLILAGVGTLIAGIGWLKGLNPANRSFNVIVEFPQISGVQTGSSVHYRGVAVGRIVSIEPGANGVKVQISIAPADLVIPANSDVTLDQAGLLGESVLNISPQKGISATTATRPLDAACDRSLILCNGSTLKGATGVSSEELIRSSIRFANTYGDPKFLTLVTQLLQTSNQAAGEIALTTREFRGLAQATRGEIATLSLSAASVGGAANQVGQAASQFGGIANQAGLTLGQINSLVATNRSTLVSTLDNLNETSGTLKGTVAKLGPTLDRVSNGQLLQNLETLSANAAQASVNLRDASQSLNNPANLVLLQQTLESARATFQNAQKITADLDELTGDPKTRVQLKQLINGLGKLVATSETLQRQTQYAQVIAPLAAQASRSAASGAPLPAFERPASALVPADLLSPPVLGVQGNPILPPRLSALSTPNPQSHPQAR
jgi:phospholipid/cholesterol/gamma-HCH transport system substrate-binding protein